MIAALVIVPILAGLGLALVPRSAEAAAKWIGVGIAFGAFVVTALAYGAPDESVRWLARPFAANFHVGLGTGPSYWIVLLLTLSTGCALMVTRVPRARDFIAQMLVLLGAMTGVFVARDLLLFALFWDLMLIPVFITLVAWSQPKSTATAWKYLVYNLSGGLALLLATAAYGIVQGTTDVIGVDPRTLAAISPAWAFWICAGFALAFLIKTPVWPLHTWMPDTYCELPAPMVAVVGAVQSKAGLYGFIVVGLTLFPAFMHAAAPLMFALGLIALVYGALAALVQDDVRRVVAYSSLSHLGLIILAIFSFDAVAIGGAVVYIVAHGLFSAGLFITIGEVESREDTRLLSRLGGLATRNPRLAGGLTIVSLAALGLPGLCGFAGEILILTGLYRAGFVWPTIVALLPIVAAAAYMLRAFQGVMHGPEQHDLPQREDMTPVEMVALAPLVVAIVLLGINPGPLTRHIAPAAKVSISYAAPSADPR
ncbi:MAG: NADH-quinone oxidoreductase subunit M [Vulcanimicrobiaceae bacterium]